MINLMKFQSRSLFRKNARRLPSLIGRRRRSIGHVNSNRVETFFLTLLRSFVPRIEPTLRRNRWIRRSEFYRSATRRRKILF